MPRVHGLEIADFEELDGGAIRVGDYIAEPLDDDMSWGMGAIDHPPADAAENQQLTAAALTTLTEVEPSEQALSICTDGRFLLTTESGLLVPVRPQLVGASMVMGFAMAEAAGEAFYGDPTKPIDERAEQTADALVAAGIMPSTHIQCGAKKGFRDIQSNIVYLTDYSPRAAAYRERNEVLLGDSYSPVSDVAFLDALRERSGDDEYGYDTNTPDVLSRAVANATGPDGTYSLVEDDRGVHGHVEKAVLRLRPEVGQVALDTRLLARLTNGDQVFGNNDGQLDVLAKAIGGDDAEVVSLARHAGEHFTNGGHGTLAKNLPTWVIRLATAA